MPRKKPRLIYTLLVKDEVELIEDNINFHLKRGVDDIIVTDNGSTDGTLEILRKFERQGLILLLHDPVFEQQRIVNKMGKIAQEQLQATILIHSDADEFWQPTEGQNLKKAFLEQEHPILTVKRFNVLPQPHLRAMSFPQAEMLVVNKPMPSKNLQDDCKRIGMFLLESPPKVMFSVSDKFRKVVTGNHGVLEENKIVVTDKILVYHFPFKSAQGFIEETKKMGKSTLENEPNPGINWHIRDWYQQINEGRAQKLLDKLIPNDLGSRSDIGVLPFNYLEKIRDSKNI